MCRDRTPAPNSRIVTAGGYRKETADACRRMGSNGWPPNRTGSAGRTPGHGDLPVRSWTSISASLYLLCDRWKPLLLLLRYLRGVARMCVILNCRYDSVGLRPNASSTTMERAVSEHA